MAWPVAALLLTGWILGWLVVGSAQLATREGKDWVAHCKQWLIAFVVASCGLGFLLTSGQRGPFRPDSVGAHERALWKDLHHAGFWGLFAFLFAGQYSQLEAAWKRRKGLSPQRVLASYYRHWVLTELVPAPVALLVFLTGLRLLWQAPGDLALPAGRNSFSQFWLQALVISFAFFFWDGILGYTPIVRRLYGEGRPVDEGTGQHVRTPTLGESCQLWLHLLAWPLVLLVGIFRWGFRTPLSEAAEWGAAHLRMLPPGWPEVLTALALFGAVGAGVWLWRRGRQWSPAPSPGHDCERKRR